MRDFTWAAVLLVLLATGCGSVGKRAADASPSPLATKKDFFASGATVPAPSKDTGKMRGAAVSVSSAALEMNDDGGTDLESVVPEEFRLESEIREAVVDLALAQLDIRYRYGGVSWETGYDCSGFVRWVFQNNGVSLPRTARTQAGVGIHVDKEDLRKGDLVFFRLQGRIISHVGIYLGNGMFIHANRTGGEVRVSMLSNPFWSRKYAGARSVL
jgi:cell wall-associated NlpC family hydrolase